MDFASLMSSQIAAVKPTDDSGGRKYLKRSEVEAQREADYRREQEELEKARLERLDKKRKRDDEEAETKRVREEKRQRLAEESRKRTEEEKLEEEKERRRRLGLPELPEKKDEVEDGLQDGENGSNTSDEDVLEKLRDLGEPRRLFGETPAERQRRYQKLTAKALAPRLSDGPIPTTLDLLPEADMKVSETVPSDPAAQKYLHRQIGSYFDMLLREWAAALARRPQEVKDSLSGKQALNNYVSARDALRPLFAKLESAALSPVLRKAVNEIVHLAQLKKYVYANDAYLRLSIGKAAWPIGVTMVGIHERSAREKLHGGDQEAHIMSDEGTRKMLQGIKRCLSFAQTRWPPEDRAQIMG